ncbi:hypothetical protein AYO38_09790 [bacterium SCGC AG-212-C10]|nr:hypothetical protein AYO38_09790 [bacterium SCGC AG-212-C10]
MLDELFDIDRGDRRAQGDPPPRARGIRGMLQRVVSAFGDDDGERECADTRSRDKRESGPAAKNSRRDRSNDPFEFGGD